MDLSTDQKYLEHEFTTLTSLYWSASGWNVASVRSVLADHDAGSLARSSALSVITTRHPSVFGALRQRKALPLAHKRRVTGSLQGISGLACAGFGRVMTGLEPMFGDVFRPLAMMGFAVLHHHWRASADASTLEPITKPWPLAAVIVNDRLGRLEAVTSDGLVPILDDGHWTVIGTGLRPQLDGAIRAVGLPWAAATYAEADEAALSAFLGRLCPIGILPETIQPGSPEGFKFTDAVKDLGEAQSGGVFPNGSTITTLPNIDAGAAALFTGLINRRAAAMKEAILGTAGASSPGVYLSPFYGEVQFSVAREDVTHGGRGFSRLGQAYGGINYGLSPEESPGYEWLLPDTTEAERLDAIAKRYTAAAGIVKAERDAGLAMTPDRIKQIYGDLSLAPPTMPESSAKAPIFAYHVETDTVARDETRGTLGFDPLPDGVGSAAALAEHIKAVRAAEIASKSPTAPAAPAE